MATQPNTKADYDKLASDLAAIEKATGLYLADENVDAENCSDAGVTSDHSDYWDLMYRNATSAAGMRAEESGEDINNLLGRIVF